MTAVTERLRELVERHDPRELPPLSEELCRALNLPGQPVTKLTIAQVAAVTGVSAHTLRYYERIGLVKVGRDKSGHRAYDRAALGQVMFVTRLRLSDMPIQKIRRYIDLVNRGEGTAPERLALMQAHRATIVGRLQDLQAALAVIDYKITTYGGHCGP